MAESQNDPNRTIGSLPDSESQFGEPAITLEPGMVLNDKYELLEQVGRGGMGVVWKAHDRVAERLVALKFVPRDLRRFEAEMKRARETFSKVHALNHQSICPLYGLEDGGVSIGHYIVMKYLDGYTLSSFVSQFDPKRKGLPLNKVTALITRVARALDYAHQNGVIHRDIKPSNIFLTKTTHGYEVQVIDFGLADEIKSNLTRVSQVTFSTGGTRPYMAPEQWRGRLQTAATDQYALAVVAYELLTGHLPFEGNDIEMLRLAVLQDAPGPIRSIPEYVNAAIQKALSKDAIDRFESCSAFAKSLESEFIDLSSVEELQPEESKSPGISHLLAYRLPLWMSICVAFCLSILLTMLFTTVVWGVTALMQPLPDDLPPIQFAVNDLSQPAPLFEPVDSPYQPVSDDTNIAEIIATTDNLADLSVSTEPVPSTPLQFVSSFNDVFEAVQKGSIEDINYFIEQGVDINKRSTEGKTPLHCASRSNSDVEVVKYLVEKSEGTNIKDDSGHTPFHYAVCFNPNIEVVKYLGENQADVDVTLLLDAAKYNPSIEVFKYLIDNGADINMKDEKGNTPLHYAAGSNPNTEVVRYLVKNGANNKALNTAGQTPSGFTKSEVKIDAICSASGQSMLLYGFSLDNMFGAAYGGSVEDIKRLIRINGVRTINESNIKGYFPPIQPTGEKHSVYPKCDYDSLVRSWSPLHIAARFNTCPEVLEYMIDQGANVNVRDLAHRTPLHYAACMNPNAEIMKCLIEGGADINAKDSLANGFDLTPLYYAAGFNPNVEVTKYLVENGAEANIKNKFGVTPLQYAAQFNSNADVLKFLLENGCDINAENPHGFTLHLAACSNSVDILKLLIDNGLDVNAKTNDGRTALHCAAGSNPDIDVLKFLVDKGLDVKAKNNDGKTPLHMLAQRDSVTFPDPSFQGEFELMYQNYFAAAMKYLINHGADINVKDKNGNTPYDLIFQNASPGNGKAISLLRDAGGKRGHEL